MTSFIPETVWKSMGDEVIKQICNIAYFDNKKSPERYPKREILNIITAFLEKNINIKNPKVDGKFKEDFFKVIAAALKPPVAKMYENDIMAIRLMEGILNDSPHIFMNIINTVADKSIQSKDDARFIDIFMKTMNEYIRVENQVSQNMNIYTVSEMSSTSNADGIIEIEDIPNLQKSIIDNIKTYSALKNSENIDKMNDLTDEELIEQIDKIIDNVIEKSKDEASKTATNSPLSAVSSMIPDINPVKIIIQETVGNMPKEFVDKVFKTLDTSKEKPYEEIKTKIYDTIMSALQYHLGRPEGRQMYLRQIEPFVRHYAIQSLMNDDTTTICIFQIIRDSTKINSIIQKCVVKTYASKNRNFQNPSFGNIRGGAPNPFKAFRNALEPSVNKVLGKNMPDKGSMADLAKGSMADLAKGSMADLAKGSMADLAKGSMADLAKGSMADLAKGSMADLAKGSMADLAKGSMADLAMPYVTKSVISPEGEQSTPPKGEQSTQPEAEQSTQPEAEQSTPPEGEQVTQPEGEPVTPPEGEQVTTAASEPVIVPINRFDKDAVVEAYKNTFAYDVYNLVNDEIQKIINGSDPIAQIYKDLDQFKVPELVKIKKNTIEYAQTMCSPGILKNKISKSLSSNKSTKGGSRNTFRKLVQKKYKYTRRRNV